MCSKQSEKISIIIPVYNGEKFIAESIDSVLHQTYSNWELIIINDGSTDNSVRVIKSYNYDNRIILLEHPEGINKGVSKSRELGVKAATGKFLAFLDADDIFYPNKLGEQVEILLKYDEVILTHSKVEIIHELESNFINDFSIDNQDKLYDLKDSVYWLTSNKICNSTVLIRSSVLKNLQFGLLQLFQFEDWLLWSLLAEKGKFYYRNNSLIKYRLHGNSATASILENKLIYPYSKIEFLISFYLTSQSNIDRTVIINKLNSTLVELAGIYSNGNLQKINSFKASLESLEDQQHIKIRVENSKLKQELVKLRTNDHSYFKKLIEKLKHLFT